MIFAPTLSNPFQLPYINPNFGTSGTSGTGGTGGGSAVNYTLIRYEGTSSTSGTPGFSTCIYECYIFVNGQIELRIGNWANTGGVSGHYTAGGTGTSFTATANTTYVWNATGTTTTFYSSYQYINGALSASGSIAPSQGAGAASSWPPAGWQNLVNSSVDDGFSNITITATTIMGTLRNTACVGSNAYITFGSCSSNWSSLSTTNPPYDKFMFSAGDRSYQRVAYTTGSK